MPNKLSQFWHELKRRKVVRVITVYINWGSPVSNNILNDTEDYTTILESKSKRKDSNNEFLPGKSCNGLAVFEGKNLMSFDIFGNRDAYQSYFDLLAGNALSRVQDDAGKDAAAMEQAEAFYRLDEYLDMFESELELEIPVKVSTTYRSKVSI